MKNENKFELHMAFHIENQSPNKSNLFEQLHIEKRLSLALGNVSEGAQDRNIS